MTNSSLHMLADRAATEHLESARYYAMLNAGDWIAVEADGRTFFPAARPMYGDVVMAVPLTAANTKSAKALRAALVASTAG